MALSSANNSFYLYDVPHCDYLGQVRGVHDVFTKLLKILTLLLNSIFHLKSFIPWAFWSFFMLHGWVCFSSNDILRQAVCFCLSVPLILITWSHYCLAALYTVNSFPICDGILWDHVMIFFSYCTFLVKISIHWQYLPIPVFTLILMK